MQSSIEIKLELKKEWTAPKLKKVGVEEITAHLTASGNDGNGGHTAS